MEQPELNPNSVNELSEFSSSSVDDDGPPVLSSQALAALKEFIAEQNHSVSHSNVATGEDSKVALVSEDWRLSQFWYSAETAKTLAEEVITLCQGTDHSRVACIACPTLYAYLKKLHPNVPLQLLEYDKRFKQYGSDYAYYDYNKPEELPSGLKNSFKVVVADPPYLVRNDLRDGSKECLEKVAETISFLKQPGESYLLLLTGEVQKERAAEVLGLYPCGFRPRHSSKLGNEFRLFTNYDPGTRLGGYDGAVMGLSGLSVNCHFEATSVASDTMSLTRDDKSQ